MKLFLSSIINIFIICGFVLIYKSYIGAGAIFLCLSLFTTLIFIFYKNSKKSLLIVSFISLLLSAILYFLYINNIRNIILSQDSYRDNLSVRDLIQEANTSLSDNNPSSYKYLGSLYESLSVRGISEADAYAVKSYKKYCDLINNTDTQICTLFSTETN